MDVKSSKVGPKMLSDTPLVIKDRLTNAVINKLDWSSFAMMIELETVLLLSQMSGVCPAVEVRLVRHPFIEVFVTHDADSGSITLLYRVT